MASIPYSVVDVFSAKPFRGNPLAIVDNTSDVLQDEQMKLIAREFNLSETTFFSHPVDSRATYKLRSYLPDGREVFGMGHNILGVWWFLASEGKLDMVQPNHTSTDKVSEEFTFYQELGGEVSTVQILRNKSTKAISVSLRQSPPHSHGFHPDNASLASALQIEPNEIGLENTPRLLPQVMATSTTRHLIVPLTSIEALNRVQVDRKSLLEQLAEVDEKAYGLFMFAKQPGQANTFQARFFSPGMSGEDPATGSAAGPLSAYLYRHGCLELENDRADIKVVQGLQVGRECVISVKLTHGGGGTHGNALDGELQVDISGPGAHVAKGQILIPSD